MRLRLEALEDRITPTTFTPTTFLDDGTLNSLRGAITQANFDNGTGTDTIQLQAGTYQLTIPNSGNKHDALANKSGDLNIINESHALVIQGTTDAKGNPTTFINQTVADRVFQVELANANVTFKDVVIEGGRAQDTGGEGTVAGSTTAEGGGILVHGGDVTLINVVLQKNSAASAGFDAFGGGIYADAVNTKQPSLTIQSSVIQLNGADAGTSPILGREAFGGGIYATGPTTITDSEVSGNEVTGGNASSTGSGGQAGGGGLFAENGTTITDSTLVGNTLTGSNGGFGGFVLGGSVVTSGKTTITDSKLGGNMLTGGTGSNGEGGGVAGGSVFSSNGLLTLTGCTLSGNTLIAGNGSLSNSATTINGDLGGDAAGGGVYLLQNTASVSTCVISDNTLAGGKGNYSSGVVQGSIGGAAAGGGIYADTTSAATLESSTLSGNTLTGGSGSGGAATPGAAQGGGAYLAGAGDTLVNSTIAGNQVIGGASASAPSTSNGGGLYFDTKVTATLTNVTVADNKASLPTGGTGNAIGGGIDNVGSAALINTLVADNKADSSSPDYNGAVSSSSHNLIGNSIGSSGFSASHGDLLGSTDKPVNPHLGSLANNGGPTQTLALLPGSPALNAGDNSAQAATGSTDQRGQGFTRIVNGTIDIGAFEDQKPSGSGGGEGGGGKSPPAPKPPPTLHTPPLLAFIDSLFGGIETINSNGTETVTDRFLGIPLFVSTYDGNGNLSSVTIFGMDITFLFE